MVFAENFAKKIKNGPGNLLSRSPKKKGTKRQRRKEAGFFAISKRYLKNAKLTTWEMGEMSKLLMFGAFSSFWKRSILDFFPKSPRGSYLGGSSSLEFCRKSQGKFILGWDLYF